MDIYDVNEDLVRTLVKLKKIQVYSREFNSKQENYEKVNFVENLLVDFQQLQKVKLKVTVREGKNNDKSVTFRKEGNEHFSLKKRNYFKALELYNKSICYSEIGSENIAIGYANRSAVLFEWKRYRECLENIQLARTARYPARLMHKLIKRERDCLDLMDTQPDDVEPYNFKIDYDRHPSVPFVADCLEMKYSQDQGRYICTTKFLVPGELVAIEEPFCSALLPAMKYIRCANCKRENYLTLFPCTECTSAMFCSEECREEAMQTFHQYECAIVDCLFTLFNKIHRAALRVCLTAISIFSNIEECIAFCRDPQNQNQSCFSLDYTNFTKLEHYKAIHGLITNQEKRDPSDLFQRSVIAAVLRRYLIDHTPLKEFLNGNDGENFLAELLFKHLQTSPSNMHSIDLIEQKNETKDDQCFASAALPLHSLVNHSCAPNTVRTYRGTTSYLFILRPIKANGILYDNYGYHFATEPKNIRQKNLDMQYRFVCKCEACEADYPLFLSIEHVSQKFIPECTQRKDIESLMAYDRDYALKNYQRYCDYLNKYAKYYPCQQISSAEESLKMALNILVDAVPLKAKV